MKRDAWMTAERERERERDRDRERERERERERAERGWVGMSTWKGRADG